MLTLYCLIWIFILTSLVPTSYNEDNQCKLASISLEGIQHPGDIIIGAVLPVRVVDNFKELSFTEPPPRTTCTTLHFGYFQQLQALLFAVEEINRNENILPNITLGFHWYDSCGVISLNIAAMLQVLSGDKIAIPNYRCLHNVPLSGFIGSSSSTLSIAVAHILGLYKYPQLCYSLLLEALRRKGCTAVPLVRHDIRVLQDTAVDMDIQALCSSMDNLVINVQKIQDTIDQKSMLEPRIPIPDLFFGDRTKFLSFKNNCAWIALR
ncbi:unnamed protein product [Ranitomeya imitator]|uniref:Receptor ligand binding region domain-containing protein n=1 Tax=Ranitomeya imitator TaxID=111125 RepID=A0ABN9M902_9NEOB|nr:unnamed protein product [Ranitomeya imitator]